MQSSSTSEIWLGRLIGDRQRYRLEQCIGSGGMGDVFIAMDILLGQQVALKLLKDTLTSSGDLRKRFEREVALCAALKSENIVQVSDYGVTTEGHPFYVMEFLRGQTLGQLLRREKRLAVERTVDIIKQVCAGLQLAHTGVALWREGATVSERIQVVHRDLKPDNIFLVPTSLGELVKILDFGIAKIRDDAAEYTNLTSTFLGTFRYAAPEQLQLEQDLDGRADIYSLGIILYEMLSGSDPFGFSVKARSPSGVSWGLAHASKPPQPLRIQPGCEQIPAELEAVVLRCLEKLPNQRFQSVTELSQALQSSISRLSHPPAAFGQEIKAPIAQTIAKPVQGSYEDTIYRSPTPCLLNQSEVTEAQVPISQQQRQSEVTAAQISPPPKPEVEQAIARVSTPNQPQRRRRSTPLLLIFAAGFAVGLAAIAAMYGYFYFQTPKGSSSQPQQSTTPATSAPTPTDPCEDPQSQGAINCPW